MCLYSPIQLGVGEIRSATADTLDFPTTPKSTQPSFQSSLHCHRLISLVDSDIHCERSVAFLHALLDRKKLTPGHPVGKIVEQLNGRLQDHQLLDLFDHYLPRHDRLPRTLDSYLLDLPSTIPVPTSGLPAHSPADPEWANCAE